MTIAHLASPKSPMRALAVLLRDAGNWVAVLGRNASMPAAEQAGRAPLPSAVSKDASCLFCRQDDPAANKLLCQNDSFFARLDNFPATAGHVEVVPKRHVVSFFDLMGHEVADAYALLQTARKLLDREHDPDGYTIGINEGSAAGRSVDHLHIHLIPRRTGDVPDPRGGIRRCLPNGNPDLWY